MAFTTTGVAATLPPGLLERLVVDLTAVRPSEIARARRALAVACLDDPSVIDAIAERLLDVASW